jgi:hypothetical protein
METGNRKYSYGVFHEPITVRSTILSSKSPTQQPASRKMQKVIMRAISSNHHRGPGPCCHQLIFELEVHECSINGQECFCSAITYPAITSDQSHTRRSQHAIMFRQCLRGLRVRIRPRFEFGKRNDLSGLLNVQSGALNFEDSTNGLTDWSSFYRSSTSRELLHPRRVCNQWHVPGC